MLRQPLKILPCTFLLDMVGFLNGGEIMDSAELTNLIVESSNKVIQDNQKLVVESLKKALSDVRRDNTPEAIGDIISKSVSASINMSVQLSVAATLSALAKLGAINLEVE